MTVFCLSMQPLLILTSERTENCLAGDGLYCQRRISTINAGLYTEIIKSFPCLAILYSKDGFFTEKDGFSVYESELHTLKCIFLLIWFVYRHKLACMLFSGLESIEWRRIFAIEGKQPVKNVVWISFFWVFRGFWVKAPPCDQNFSKPLRHFEVPSSTIKISHSTWL